LESLRDRGAPVAVLSNIAWDVRPIFKHFGIDHLISGYVLSYEVGVGKPDPEVFRIACSLLGFAHAPRDVLMVGDNRVADGGATAIGCEFRLVGHLPVNQRPRALLDAVEGVHGAGSRVGE
ncbi:MAG: HAD family hydrolase, partial [Actinocrinis sp.]